MPSLDEDEHIFVTFRQYLSLCCKALGIFRNVNMLTWSVMRRWRQLKLVGKVIVHIYRLIHQTWRGVQIARADQFQSDFFHAAYLSDFL